MTSHTGYLLIADISGYTAYLTSSEQEHANSILESLLTTLVENIDEPLHLWKMDAEYIVGRCRTPAGRIGPGSGYHYAHEAADFRYAVTDWKPFDYFSTLMQGPANEGLAMHETYALTPTETGTEVRYTMSRFLIRMGNVLKPNRLMHSRFSKYSGRKVSTPLQKC
jgi:hypothetical protein